MPIGIVLEDILASLTARVDVIQVVGEFDADQARHCDAAPRADPVAAVVAGTDTPEHFGCLMPQMTLG
jgi:hypothetical protein